MICPRCGCPDVAMLPGVGPHAAKEECPKCRWTQWVPKSRASDVETLRRNAAELEARRDAERMPLFRGGDR